MSYSSELLCPNLIKWVIPGHHCHTHPQTWVCNLPLPELVQMEMGLPKYLDILTVVILLWKLHQEEKLTSEKHGVGRRNSLWDRSPFDKPKVTAWIILKTYVVMEVDFAHLTNSHRRNMQLWRKYLAVPIIPCLISKQEQPIKQRHRMS